MTYNLFMAMEFLWKLPKIELNGKLSVFWFYCLQKEIVENVKSSLIQLYLIELLFFFKHHRPVDNNQVLATGIQSLPEFGQLWWIYCKVISNDLSCKHETFEQTLQCIYSSILTLSVCTDSMFNIFFISVSSGLFAF